MSTTAHQRRELIGMLVMAALTLFAYRDLASAGFVNFDDSVYVQNNPQVSSGLSWDGVKWALTSFSANNWHPLTWLSFQLDATLFDCDPFWLHLENLAWHLGSAVLLFLLLARLTGERALAIFCSFVFALHPQHVESVAWVSERKDVLSTFFGIASLLAYERYARRRELRAYGWMCLSMLASLCAKPMLVTLPGVFLLLDIWPLHRLRTAALLLEKLPPLMLSVLCCLLTLAAQNGASSLFPELTPAMRIANAVSSYALYLRDFVWPWNLAVFYPHPLGALPLAQTTVAAVLMAVLTWLAIRWRREHPYLWFGWCWFLLTLVPALGLVQVGYQARADRYLYFPSIGLTIASVWFAARGFAAIAARWRLPDSDGALGSFLVGFAACVWTPITARQAGFWTSSVRLWQRAVTVSESTGYDLTVPRTNLAQALLEENRTMEAERELETVTRGCAGPRCAAAEVTLGQLLNSVGQPQRALAHLEKAHLAQPEDPFTRRYYGLSLAFSGHSDEALPHLKWVVERLPNDAQGHLDLAEVLHLSGDSAAGEAETALARRLDPNVLNPLVDRAWRLAQQPGRGAESLFRARQVCRVVGCRDAGGQQLLAAAHAADRLFEDAVKLQAHALELLAAEGREEDRQAAERRLAAYRKGWALWEVR